MNQTEMNQMNVMKMMILKEKNGERKYDVSTDMQMHTVCQKVLSERLNAKIYHDDGFFYNNVNAFLNVPFNDPKAFKKGKSVALKLLNERKENFGEGLRFKEFELE